MVLENNDLIAFLLTLKLAFFTSLILMLICLPAAFYLAQKKEKWVQVIEALVALPLVLPPTVLGFYLLIILGPKGWIGQFVEFMGWPRVVFNFEALLIGSIFFSLPFVFQPLHAGFKGVNRSALEMAACMGISPLKRLITVVLPAMRPALITSFVLGFAHTLGEFGVVLMLGGNRTGETQVLSIRIYEHVESFEYAKAHQLSLILLVFSFVMLFVVYGFNSKNSRGSF